MNWGSYAAQPCGSGKVLPASLSRQIRGHWTHISTSFDTQIAAVKVLCCVFGRPRLRQLQLAERLPCLWSVVVWMRSSFTFNEASSIRAAAVNPLILHQVVNSHDSHLMYTFLHGDFSQLPFTWFYSNIEIKGKETVEICSGSVLLAGSAADVTNAPAVTVSN